MADISITAANVVPGSDAVRESGTAGATITAGQLVYLDTSDMKYKLADSNGAAALRVPNGIALNGASNGQPLSVQKGGDITIGGTMTAGIPYFLSDTPGGLCPLPDIGTGEYSCIVGIAKSTSVLSVNIQPSGVAL
jgi:hypothetical protein